MIKIVNSSSWLAEGWKWKSSNKLLVIRLSSSDWTQKNIKDETKVNQMHTF